MFIYGSAIAIVGSLWAHKQRERLSSSEMLKKSEECLANYTGISTVMLGNKRRFLSDVTTSVGNKCPCCGSYEFRQHVSIIICSYCRVPK